MPRIAVAVVALLAAALAGCGGQGAAPAERDTVTVESEDGSAVLSIPTGALPNSTGMSDVRIEDLPRPSGDDQVLAVYALHPDGLELLTPATMTIEVTPGQAAAGVFVVHSSGPDRSVVELITDVSFEVSPENDTVFVSAQFSHFSEMRWNYGPFFRA